MLLLTFVVAVMSAPAEWIIHKAWNHPTTRLGIRRVARCLDLGAVQQTTPLTILESR